MPLGAGAFGSGEAAGRGQRPRSPSRLGPLVPEKTNLRQQAQKAAASVEESAAEARREASEVREDPVEAVARALAASQSQPSSFATETAAALADARRHLHSLLGGVCTLQDPGPLPPRPPPPAGDIRAKPPKVVASSSSAAAPSPPSAAPLSSSSDCGSRAVATTPTTVRAEGLLVDLRRLRAAGDALAAEAEAKKCFGLGGGGGFDEGRQPHRPASPAALPLSSASRPSSTDSLGGGGEAAAAKRKQKQQQRETKKKDPAVEQYLDELSRLRAEAEKAFSGTAGERAAVA